MDGHWEPECWHKSPVQLREEAKAMNEMAFRAACADGGKHSNPPNHPHPR